VILVLALAWPGRNSWLVMIYPCANSWAVAAPRTPFRLCISIGAKSTLVAGGVPRAVLHSAMKLHFVGKQVKEGWKILNIQAAPGVDYIGDISDLSQFANGSIEEIYASHVLEHARQPDIPATLEGLFRVLKWGGKLKVSLPDIDVLCKIIIDPALSTEHRIAYLGMVFGGQTDAYDYHYFGWTYDIMRHFCTEAGFGDVERVVSFGLFSDTNEILVEGTRISLNVIATK